MAKNFVQPGDVLEFTAPSGGVVSGSVYRIGQFVGIATVTAAEGVRFNMQLVGVWMLPKVSAQAWTVGQLLFWDNAAGLVTSTSGAGLTHIGAAAAAAANPSATGKVRLNGIAIANV